MPDRRSPCAAVGFASDLRGDMLRSYRWRGQIQRHPELLRHRELRGLKTTPFRRLSGSLRWLERQLTVGDLLSA